MIGSVVVVGASLAGMHAAHTLRREGFEGRLTVVDADPATPYDRPPLSKQVLAGEWEPDRIVLPAVDEDLDLDLHLGRRAMGLDRVERVVRLDGGDRLGYDGLVIATGAAARWLPRRESLAGVHVLRTLDDCLGLRRALEGRPGPRRRRRRRVHRRRGGRHLPGPWPRGDVARGGAGPARTGPRHPDRAA